MKKEAIKDKYIVNGVLTSTKNEEIFEQITKAPIYEVIRVMNGVPLFFEEHLDRMRKSSEIVDYEILRDDKEIKNDVKILIKENDVENLNIKLLCTDIEGKGQVFLAYFIESYYPDAKVYKEGIHTILYHYERQNPNAKVLNVSFKEDVNRRIKEEEAFEALLVNGEGYITEGSRSNMFFVKGTTAYTAPKGEVLLGVTRNHIMDVCMKLNIKVIEERIHIEDLGKIDGAFMTGTSVNALPITTIDDRKYNSVDNSIIKEVGKGYMESIKKYLEEKKAQWE